MKFGIFLTTLILASICAIVGAFGYYVTYRTDSRLCPWAFSLDENKPLLVGKWVGQFTEPDSLEKKISIEIYEPYSKTERIFTSIGFPYSQRMKLRDMHKFDGLMTVESKFGKKEFKLEGHVNAKNMQFFEFHLLTNDNRSINVPYSISFIITNGFWKSNVMSFILNVIYYNSSSSKKFRNLDYQLSKKVKVTLNRFKSLNH
ncbi:hypothetical protein [Emticicia sp. SJ17W-69]|uniref:hypothetical protein n=1 Tax=Emticicia sp. SJ17W-69 TaxID=3421657 RepID=UPI003EBCCDDD